MSMLLSILGWGCISGWDGGLGRGGNGNVGVNNLLIPFRPDCSV